MMGQCLEPPMIEVEPTMTFPAEVQALIGDLNPDQLRVFSLVFGKLMEEKNGGQEDKEKTKPLLVMLHGEAGTGKTHLYKKICKAAEIMGIGAVICASTGIAATTIEKCSTVHSTFGLSIFCATNPDANDKAPSEAIKKAKILIFDEVSMLDVKVLHCVDQKLRKYCENDQPFGGKSVLLGGDRMQLVPPTGNKNSIYASANIMKQFYHVELKEQMRQSGDPDFNQWLRNIGTGQVKWVKIPQQNTVNNIEKLIKFVFGEEMKENEGLIITPTNRGVNYVNEIALNMIDGVEEWFEANDTLAKGMETPPEEELSKIPPKRLKLKSGAIVMLLKNVSVENGLANGTRLIYKSNDKSNALICEDLNGKQHKIYRQAMNQQIKDGVIRRMQFPIRLAFSTTIHKGQSQTVDRLGIYMPAKSFLFAEGMCYTAFSRLRRMIGLRIFVENAQEEILLRNLCSPFALSSISADGKWIPAPSMNDDDE